MARKKLIQTDFDIPDYQIECPNKGKKTMPNGRQVDNWIQNLIIIYPFKK